MTNYTSDLKINKFNIGLWGIASFFAVFSSDLTIYYVCFAIHLLLLIHTKGNTLDYILISILAYSCILPDNYAVIFSSFLFLFYILCKRTIKKKNLYLITAFIFVFIISSFANNVPSVNIFFSLFYLYPAIIIFVCFNEMYGSKNKTLIQVLMLEIFFIEFIAMIANWAGKMIGIERPIPGDDWSTGTMGNGQGNPLFMIIAIIFLANYEKISKSKTSYKILFAASALTMLLSSHSYALLMAFMVSALIGYMYKSGIRKVIIRTFPLVFIFMLFIHVRGFDRLILNAFTNPDTFIALFPKIKIFIAAFIEIPIMHPEQSLWGAGPGQFSSRAAATCTGLYISFYNKLFQPSIGPWMKKYVYDWIYMAHLHSEGDFGSILKLPYSSITSVMGELGILGIILSGIFVSRLKKGLNNSGSLLLIFLFTACILDNWLEYAKVMSLFMMGICINKV